MAFCSMCRPRHPLDAMGQRVKICYLWIGEFSIVISIGRSRRWNFGGVAIVFIKIPSLVSGSRDIQPLSIARLVSQPFRPGDRSSLFFMYTCDHQDRI